MSKLALCTAALIALAPMVLSSGPLSSAALAADPSALTFEQAAAATARKDVPTTGDFLVRVTAENRFAIDSGELALKKSQSPAVLAFAKMMVADHTDAAAKLQQILGEAMLSSGPDALDARHRVVLDDLATRNGADFDKAYLDAETKAHKRAVALFESYADGGDNAPLKQFAQELLPVLKKHLEQIAQISG